MKPITFAGNSLDAIRVFPQPVRCAAGFQLEKVQRGLPPDEFSLDALVALLGRAGKRGKFQIRDAA